MKYTQGIKILFINEKWIRYFKNVVNVKDSIHEACLSLPLKPLSSFFLFSFYHRHLTVYNPSSLLSILPPPFLSLSLPISLHLSHSIYFSTYLHSLFSPLLSFSYCVYSLFLLFFLSPLQLSSSHIHSLSSLLMMSQRCSDCLVRITFEHLLFRTFCMELQP